MIRHFDTSLRELKEQLVTMAGLVEKAIEEATLGLEGSQQERFLNVYELEKKINQCHIQVDSVCLKLLALQQPLAADLRLIIAIIKINTDLERMGDQAVNIAGNATEYVKNPPLKPLVDLPVMFKEVRFMVREALDSFVKNDLSLARDVLKRDHQVDGLKHKIFKDVLEHLKTHANQVEQGLTLILIARNLERIGDHSTNIAEDVIFAITGDDVRHTGHVSTIKDALQAD